MSANTLVLSKNAKEYRTRRPKVTDCITGANYILDSHTVLVYFKKEKGSDTIKESYADCFAAAVAKIFQGLLVTGDPEFKLLQNYID